MKKLLLVSVLGSLIISSSAFASEGKKDFTFTSTSTTSNTTDLSFAFDDIDSLNIVAMNDEEMDKTEGAILPLIAFAAWGANIYAWKNHYDHYQEHGTPASVEDTIEKLGKGAAAGAALHSGSQAVKGVKNLAFDGPDNGFKKHKNGRIFGIRHGISGNEKKPIFRLDYQNNPSPSKLHIHLGKGDENQKIHRPIYAPWKGYLSKSEQRKQNKIKKR